MGLAQSLPSPDQMANLLIPILGDETQGTGIVGVRKLLDTMDTSLLSTSLAARLDGVVQVSVSVDTPGMLATPLANFQSALDALPSDPLQLTASLSTALETIKNLSSGNLSAELQTALDGLGNLRSLLPNDADDLIGMASQQFSELKGEFISGSFGELKQWSDSVQAFHDELKPLIDSGVEGLEERLLGWLREKVEALIRLVLPNNPLLPLITSLDNAVTLDPLPALESIKVNLIASINLAQADFDAGNFTNTLHLQAALDQFQELLDGLNAIADTLRPLLDQPLLAADALASLLRREFERIAGIEVVDVGNIKDKFSEAIDKVRKAIEALNLDSVAKHIDDVFQKINDTVDKFHLDQFASKLNDLQNQLQGALDLLDGILFEAISTIRNLFNQVKDALTSVAETLGSYDAEGVFHFELQDQIADFLDSFKQNLHDNIQPIIDEFKTTIGQTLQQVQDGLNAVKGEIDTVKANLASMLDGINQQLQNLDVAGTIKEAGAQLDAMLDQIGVIDFDPVVDPVIAQINEMRDTLKKIDVSSLNEFTIGALKVSVEVVTHLDFSVQITDALMAEFDKLLEVPKNALTSIETSLEAILQRFATLQPKALLAPLSGVFDPITEQIDDISLEALLKPLDSWYAEVIKTLDSLSPAALLKPVLDLYQQLQGVLDSVSPSRLIQPLQSAITDIEGALQSISLSDLTEQMNSLIADVKQELAAFSPALLLKPLVGAFDVLMGVFDSFDPATLLEPFTALFDILLIPLDSLTAEHMAIINEVFGGLRAVIDLLDPRLIFKHIHDRLNMMRDLLAHLNLGGLIGSLKTPYDALNASFKAQAGPVSLTASVEVLNPLRNPVIGQITADFQRFQAMMDAVLQLQPAPGLVEKYDKDVKPKLEALIPSWARENISPEAIKRAFRLANPLNLAADVSQLYEAIKQQVRVFDPRIIQERVQATFDHIINSVLSLDPATLTAGIDAAIDKLRTKLGSFDLGLLISELDGVTANLHKSVADLNPQPIIERLEAITDELKAQVVALQPSLLLADLNEPLTAAKELIMAFDPAGLVESLQVTFDSINAILKDIDIGVLLVPLNERLQQLRDELAVCLKRTETAFNGMLAAIPV